MVTLPMPSPASRASSPASYANFTSPVWSQGPVPTFNDPEDRAPNTPAEVFPDRRVVGIHSVDLVLGLGTLHCLSQQQPKAR
ncbi:MAG: agmatine deiminase family protein [Isosphaeraceae bacterium]